MLNAPCDLQSAISVAPICATHMWSADTMRPQMRRTAVARRRVQGRTGMVGGHPPPWQGLGPSVAATRNAHPLLVQAIGSAPAATPTTLPGGLSASAVVPGAAVAWLFLCDLPMQRSGPRERVKTMFGAVPDPVRQLLRPP